MRFSQDVLYPIARFTSRFLYLPSISYEIYTKHKTLERHFHRRHSAMLSIRCGENVYFRRFSRLELSKHATRGKREPFHVHRRRFYPSLPSKIKIAFLFFIFAFVRWNATFRNFRLRLQRLYSLFVPF